MLRIPGGLFLIMTHYLFQYWHHTDAISISLCDQMMKCFGGNHELPIFSLVKMFCDPGGAAEVKVFTAGCKVIERPRWEGDLVKTLRVLHIHRLL